MSISKTRQKLIEVARSLFAHRGLEATTMNDIATASGRGRRTLYTYFRNKEEIYYAVIEEELGRLSEKMDLVMQTHAKPEDKICLIIFTHLSLIKETVARNGTLRAEFFRNIWMVQKVRRAFDTHEHQLITQVLQEGVKQQRFAFGEENLGLMADIIVCTVKGLEVPYIYDRLGEGMTDEDTFPFVRNLIVRALDLQVEPDEIHFPLRHEDFITEAQKL